jgi:hypothetical protein
MPVSLSGWRRSADPQADQSHPRAPSQNKALCAHGLKPRQPRAQQRERLVDAGKTFAADRRAAELMPAIECRSPAP